MPAQTDVGVTSLQQLGLEHKNLLVVSHVHVVTMAPEIVAEHLAPYCRRLVRIDLPFDYAPDRRPSRIAYESGRVVGTRLSHFRTPRGPLGYVRDVLQTWLWGWGREPYDLGIAADPLNALACIGLRVAGRVRHVVFYTIDYVPVRFENAWLNRLYHAIGRFAVRRADVVWNLSPAMAAARQRDGISPESAAPQLTVPLGTDPTAPAAGAETAKTIAFVGHLLPKMGVQLMLEAMPQLRDLVPGVRLVVIGTGSYEEDLKRQAARLDLGNAVTFTGRLPTVEAVQAELSRCTIGVAPYNPDLDRWTAYADPGKIKNYLACGLPVVTTGIAPIADDLVRRGCGVVVPYQADALAEAIAELLKDDARLRRCRAAAAEMGRENTWDSVLVTALTETERILRGRQRASQHSQG